jgi:hypothetical protein
LRGSAQARWIAVESASTLARPAVAALADEASTDWYTARLRSHQGDTPTLSGPEAPSWRRAWALGDREPKRRRVHRDKPWPDLG